MNSSLLRPNDYILSQGSAESLLGYLSQTPQHGKGRNTTSMPLSNSWMLEQQQLDSRTSPGDILALSISNPGGSQQSNQRGNQAKDGHEGLAATISSRSAGPVQMAAFHSNLLAKFADKSSGEVSGSSNTSADAGTNPDQHRVSMPGTKAPDHGQHDIASFLSDGMLPWGQQTAASANQYNKRSGDTQQGSPTGYSAEQIMSTMRTFSCPSSAAPHIMSQQRQQSLAPNAQSINNIMSDTLLSQLVSMNAAAAGQDGSANGLLNSGTLAGYGLGQQPMSDLSFLSDGGDDAIAMALASGTLDPSALASLGNAGGSAGGASVSPTITATSSSSLYVKNLSPDADELFLYQKFAPHGALLSCKVKTDPVTGKCRGVGFVNYVDQACALRAMQQLHGTRTAEGRQLHITLQAPRAVRAAAAAAAHPTSMPGSNGGAGPLHSQSAGASHHLHLGGGGHNSGSNIIGNAMNGNGISSGPVLVHSLPMVQHGGSFSLSQLPL